MRSNRFRHLRHPPGGKSIVLLSDVTKHNSPTDCWVALHGQVLPLIVRCRVSRYPPSPPPPFPRCTTLRRSSQCTQGERMSSLRAEEQTAVNSSHQSIPKDTCCGLKNTSWAGCAPIC